MKPSKLLCFVIIVMMLTGTACAVEFNVDSYTYDELLEIQQIVDGQIAEMQRQYAIENGNRIITFNEEEINVYAKKTQKVTPIVTKVVDDAPNKTSFVWTSSDTSIAKVSSEGVVTAVSYGDAVITATAKDDKHIFGSFVVHVILPVSKVSFAEKAITLRLSNNPDDAKASLKPLIEPETAFCQTVTWTSSNSEIVQVDENGNLKALKPGTATITATSNDAKPADGKVKKATCTVTVVRAISSIKLSETDLALNIGSSKRLTATVYPDNATNKKVTWSTSNASIATVNAEGNITAKATGTCTITATATDGSGVSASCKISVKKLISGLKLDCTTLTLAASQARKISATITPKDATTKNLTWTSSNPAIATVDSYGRVTAVKGGDCTITCATTDGSKKSATVSVHVTSFSIKSSSYSVTQKTGMTIPITYNGINYRNLSVSVNSSSFCDVNLTSSGLVITPKKAGTATVTLKSNVNTKDTIKISVSIEHSAVYDSTSYPRASYEDILRYPAQYNGDRMRIFGKVLQKQVSGNRVTLRVGTAGYGYYDKVFYIEYTNDGTFPSIIEDDKVTIYGICKGTKTYTTIMGGSVTIPLLQPEKIKLGD